MYTELRKKTNDILEIKFSHKRGFSFYFNLALSLLIFLNTLAIVLNTMPDVRRSYGNLFLDFEAFSVGVFSIEYLLRVWSCVEQPEYKHRFLGRLKFIFSPWGIIDFLAVFPFYISFFYTNFGYMRTLRLLRIIRLFRFSRYFKALRVIQAVVEDKKEELILSFSFILFLLLITSSLVFYVENPAQPAAFKSIPDSLWWGVNAMTTVGYGDIHPITPVGKLLGGILAVAGVAFFALPTGILASGFAEQIRSEKDEKIITCPHCQEEFRLNEKHSHKK